MNAAIPIRAATEADWPAIWQLFQAVAAAGDTFAYDETTTEVDAEKLWITPPSQAFVTMDDDALLGSSFIRPTQPGRGSHVANAGFMVAPDARNRGVGRALAEHALAEARRQGFLAMQFNFVVTTNESALRLWHALGFQTIGTLPAAFRHPTHGLVPVHIMHRLL